LNKYVLSTIAANLERDFSKHAAAGLESINNRNSGDTNSVAPTVDLKFNARNDDGIPTDYEYNDLEIVDVLDCDFSADATPEGAAKNPVLMDDTGSQAIKETPKAIILRDDDGNIYVHFNGTGNGAWGQNDACYVDPPSQVQKESLEFFNNYIESCLKEGLPINNVYVTGHSQGANNALYVTLNSKYGEYIEACTALDAPSISTDAKERIINTYGEAYYDMQRQKIYAVNGEHDYVSRLGQQSDVIPPENYLYVKYTPEDFDFGKAHEITGMMNGNDLGEIIDKPSDFSVMVDALTARMQNTVPEDDQRRLASVTMAVIENAFDYGDKGVNGDLHTVLTPEDLDWLLTTLSPVILDFLEEDVDLIRPALLSIGVDPDTAQLVENFVIEFNKMPRNQREDLINILSEAVTVDENGNIKLKGGFTGTMAAIQAVVYALPTIIETAISDPDKAMKMLSELLNSDMVISLISEHPFIALAVVTFVIRHPLITAGIVAAVVVFSYAIEFIYGVIEKLEHLAAEFKAFVMNCIEFVGEMIASIKQHLRSISPGGKYASSNPYFKGDPALMREYASRLKSVNRRVTSLDRSMNDLYWQVGFLDLWDILEANVLISYSAYVKLSQEFMNKAADIIESADSTVLGYMEG